VYGYSANLQAIKYELDQVIMASVGETSITIPNSIIEMFNEEVSIRFSAWTKNHLNLFATAKIHVLVLGPVNYVDTYTSKSMYTVLAT